LSLIAHRASRHCFPSFLTTLKKHHEHHLATATAQGQEDTCPAAQEAAADGAGSTAKLSGGALSGAMFEEADVFWEAVCFAADTHFEVVPVSLIEAERGLEAGLAAAGVPGGSLSAWTHGGERATHEATAGPDVAAAAVGAAAAAAVGAAAAAGREGAGSGGSNGALAKAARSRTYALSRAELLAVHLPKQLEAWKGVSARARARMA
jgi:hypothetical protein